MWFAESPFLLQRGDTLFKNLIESTDLNPIQYLWDEMERSL